MLALQEFYEKIIERFKNNFRGKGRAGDNETNVDSDDINGDSNNDNGDADDNDEDDQDFTRNEASNKKDNEKERKNETISYRVNGGEFMRFEMIYGLL
ncbi:hypothetical protein Tco_1072550 [Tanacetum coccineum]